MSAIEESKAQLLKWAKDATRSAAELSHAFGRFPEVDRAIASHPSASGELLTKLSHSNDKATRAKVAANPATPPAELVRLGQQFPKEFLENPALDLLMLENPALLEELPQALLLRLLKSDRCPAELLVWAAGHADEKVQLAVAMNAKAPEQALATLRVSQHESVLEAVSAHQASTDITQDPEKAFEQAVRDRLGALKADELYEAWSEGDIGLAQWSDLPLAFRLEKATGSGIGEKAILHILKYISWTPEKIQRELSVFQYWYRIARNSKIPVEVLLKLAKDKDSTVRCSAAENPFAPLAVLEALAKDKVSDVRCGVAKNPSTPLAVLEELARDKDSDVRCSVVKNPTTPLIVLEALANDSNIDVRRSVAKNPTTPCAILETLAIDKDKDVCLSVVKNPSALSAVREVVLEALAKEKSNYLRRSVAENASTPSAVLASLAIDKDIDVRLSVAENPSTPVASLTALAIDKNSDVRESVAVNPFTPVSVLAALALDKDIYVRLSVAENQSTPESILEILSKDKDSLVRCRVALNTSTPPDLLEIFSYSKDSDLRQSVAKNPSTPVTILETLAKDEDCRVLKCVAENPSTPVALLRALALIKDGSVLSCIAKNFRTPTDVLEKIASQNDANVLVEVANNPNTPLAALLPLTVSKAMSVRKALASHAHRTEEICRNLWRDPSDDIRLRVLRNVELDQATLDELAVDINWETESIVILEHPNLSTKSAQFIVEKLVKEMPTDSPWYQRELSSAKAEVVEAAKARSVLSYFGKDPNKAVLAKRPLAPIMALCAGPFVDPNRIVKVAGSTDWLVRAAVARNPGTPSNLLKKLTEDMHSLVAQIARKTLESTESLPVQVLPNSDGGVDLARAIRDIAERITLADADEMFRGYAQFFTDDVWVDKLHVGQIAWMTARVVAYPGNVLPLNEFPQIHGLLDRDSVALFFELAVAFERNSKSLGSIVRMWAAADPLCPINVLRELSCDEDPCIVLMVLNNVNYPQDEKEIIHVRLLKYRGNQLKTVLRSDNATDAILLKNSKSKDDSIRQLVAKNPSSSLSILRTMAIDNDLYVRRGVAENPSSPDDVLEVLAKDKDSFLRCKVALNPSTPLSVLGTLASDKDSEVRQSVAKNKSTPANILEKLAKDKESLVRNSVAENKSMPAVVLTGLAQDKDKGVLRSVAVNSSTPVEVLETILAVLVHDPSTWIRRIVADNPLTPVAILEELAKDPDRDLVRLVAKNSSAPVSLLRLLAHDSDMWIRDSVAINPTTPAALLEELSKDTTKYIRVSVAKNASTPLTVLEVLAIDQESDVRAGVARNANTPIPVLQGLAEDQSLVVRCHVARHGALQPDFRDRFINWWLTRLQRALHQESRLRAGQTPDSIARVEPKDILRALHQLGLISPTNDNKMLTQASRSKDWLTRLGAALHPGTSEGILKLLRKDADSDVAKIALSRAVESRVQT